MGEPAGASPGGGRGRALKLLLGLLLFMLLAEYYGLGLLQTSSPSSPSSFYSASGNSSTTRLYHSPSEVKRPESRHCFEEGPHKAAVVSATAAPSEGEAQSNSSLQTPTTAAGEAANTTKDQHLVFNVHNMTLRIKVYQPTDPSELLSKNVTDMDNNTSKNDSFNSDNTTSSSAETGTAAESGCDVPCPPVPPGLVGPYSINHTSVSLKELEGSSMDVVQGGRYAPRTCKPKHRVAIIVPYRDREAHLAIFLNNLHPFLMKQQIDYQIFVIEQAGKGKFNRASLMNIGYVEAGKQRRWDCFVFHDVDLLPLDDRNLYTCPEQPRHLSAAIDIFQYKLPYQWIFGGVSVLTNEQFKKVNGFSNNFWGWGGEDDDMANRINYHNYHISRYPMNIARYTMLSHDKEKPNKERYELLTKGKHQFNTEGLNSLHYTLVETQLHRLHTQVLVELQPPS